MQKITPKRSTLGTGTGCWHPAESTMPGTCTSFQSKAERALYVKPLNYAPNINISASTTLI
jgi:hypothetical protein